jgi:LytS/YehU family sensor histidine kinase
MNPHFIFNSLNSIRAYVISNETRKASDYLTKFARLIRLILHYSSLDTITLEAELEALNLYVDLEQMRYRTDFGYNIEIAPGLNPKNLLVPPLILQPYVENAIGHGLAPKQGSKQLQLKIGQSPSNLLITIRDNGVGRSFSKKIRLESKQIHQSVAMDLTSKRINLSDDGQSQSDNITITDLFDNGQPAGTEVKLQLPLQTFAPTSKKDLK